jgi:hypothetical protein
LGKQEIELEGMSETGIDKITLDIEIVKRGLKSSKSSTSCSVGGVLAELLKLGIEKLHKLLRHIF